MDKKELDAGFFHQENAVPSLYANLASPVSAEDINHLLAELSEFRVSVVNALEDINHVYSYVGKDESESNPHLRIDDAATELLIPAISAVLPTCGIWTEEQGIVARSTDGTVAFLDPFCNTSLASKGFREASTAITIVSMTSGQFITFVVDYQWPAIVFGNAGGCVERATGSKAIRQLLPKHPTSLSEAAGCASLFKRSRREYVQRYFKVLKAPKLLFSIDGAINIARLARGTTSFFVDLDVGQPSYEMLGYFMLVGLGYELEIDGEVVCDVCPLASEITAGSIRRLKALVAPPHLRNEIKSLLLCA